MYSRPPGHAILIYNVQTSDGNSGSPIQIFQRKNERIDEKTGEELYDIDTDSLQVIGVHTGKFDDQIVGTLQTELIHNQFILPTLKKYEGEALKRFVDKLNYPNFTQFEDIK